ncbi:LysM domain-containing protein [uncultured Nocardioides sp.]|uniref:LysM peptidoglycan-binding domain-containing protein n=1 Tax=uncultured Nocardioides sp. TaxID=198441 RepID=UPI00262D3325|nr:LysM domain-containing protein [uncultured Nocardioides sp.]
MTATDVPSAPALRCLGVWGGIGVAVLGLGALVAPDLTDAAAAVADGSWQARPLEVLLGWLAAAAASLALGWLWVVAGLVALDAARGVRRDAVPGCPAALRRLLLTACGAAATGALVTGLTLPASADPLPRPVPVGGSLASGALVGSADPAAAVAATPDPDGPDLHGLPMPDRAHSGPGARDADRDRGPRGRATPGDPVRPSAGEGGVHVVRPGDTLWDLAADRLRARDDRAPSAADVDAEWRALWAANADVVGPDPDLLLPGQHLRTPGHAAPDARPDHDRSRD